MRRAAIIGLGLIGGSITSSKNRGFGVGFLLGGLLGLIGIIICACFKEDKLGGLTYRPQAAGWFDDPTGRFEARYYDGGRWTKFVGKSDATSGTRQTFEDIM